MTYNGITGEGWDVGEARAAWSASMARSAPRWSLRGTPETGGFFWSFFNFKPYQGTVRITPDGFQWETREYDRPEVVMHSGLTTSLFEAYQSVERNEPVRHADRERLAAGDGAREAARQAARRARRRY
jgi:hypothetical protein